MSFPYHDKLWTDAASYLSARIRDDERVLAPDIFWWLFPRIYRYGDPWADPARRYDWVVLHKGEMQHLPRAFLDEVAVGMAPVFANDVFVIWAAAPVGGPVGATRIT